MVNIAIFASGSGTNAENLMKCFQNSQINVKRIFCNKPDAGVIQRAEKFHVPVTVFTKSDFTNTNLVIDQLRSESIDYIVLAGFLLLVPKNLIEAYTHKIINIHPALLPKYGGKGMYGHFVHEAVVANKETETGITIHLVDEVYDNGEILFQARCEVLPSDTPDAVASKIHDLEYAHFPNAVKAYIER